MRGSDRGKIMKGVDKISEVEFFSRRDSVRLKGKKR